MRSYVGPIRMRLMRSSAWSLPPSKLKKRPSGPTSRRERGFDSCWMNRWKRKLMGEMCDWRDAYVPLAVVAINYVTIR